MKANLRKLQHVACLSMKNGIRLHYDSVLLFRNRSYGTAFFVSVIAMEELGKGFWSLHYADQCKVNPRPDIAFESQLINALLTSHKGKQHAFVRELWPRNLYQKYYWLVDDKSLDRMKQDAIYVGLTKPEFGKVRTDGELINPMKTSKSKARTQINLVNGLLLEYADGVMGERIDFSHAPFNNIFNQELFDKLSSMQRL